MKRRTLLQWLGIGGLVAATGGSIPASAKRSGNRYYEGPETDHFDGRLFFNPGGKPPGSFRDLLKWQFSGDRSTWPASPSRLRQFSTMITAPSTMRPRHGGR